MTAFNIFSIGGMEGPEGPVKTNCRYVLNQVFLKVCGERKIGPTIMGWGYRDALTWWSLHGGLFLHPVTRGCARPNGDPG